MTWALGGADRRLRTDLMDLLVHVHRSDMSCVFYLLTFFALPLSSFVVMLDDLITVQVPNKPEPVTTEQLLEELTEYHLCVH